MSGQPYPKDENLRLILSDVTELDRALRYRIKASKGFVWALAIVLAIGIAWVTAEFSGAVSRPVATAMALLLIVLSAAGLAHHLLWLRRYKHYLKDHRAFLRKYHRLQSVRRDGPDHRLAIRKSPPIRRMLSL